MSRRISERAAELGLALIALAILYILFSAGPR